MPEMVDTWDGEQNTTVWVHGDGGWEPNTTDYVTTDGDQTINGTKTFTSPIVGCLDGIAASSKGFAEYSLGVDYATGATAKGSDGNLYVALMPSGPSSSAVDPVGDDSGTWRMLVNTAVLETFLADYQQIDTVEWSSAVDYAVGALVTGSDGNVYAALAENGPGTTAVDPVGDGSGTWKLLTTSSRIGVFGVALGDGAGANVPEDRYVADLVAIGTGAAENVIKARNNIAIGEKALNSNVGGRHNIAIGPYSLCTLKGYIDPDTGEYESSGKHFPATRNIGIGGNTGHFIDDGYGNIMVGRDCGHSITSGAYNILLGNGAMIGYCPNCLKPNTVINQDPSPASYNVSLGVESAKFLKGDKNILVGHQAGLNAKSPTGLVAIGHNAGIKLDSGVSPFGTEQTAVSGTAQEGTYSQAANSTTITITMGTAISLAQDYKVYLRFTDGQLGEDSANDDIWFTVQTVSSTTVFTIDAAEARGEAHGEALTGNILLSAYANTTSKASAISGTVLVGYLAGSDVASVDAVTAVGSQAGTKAGAASTYVGSLAGNTATGAQNVGVGVRVLAATTGGNNTAVGHNAARNLKSGSNNTAIGYRPLLNLTTGTGNVALGYQALNKTSSNTNFNYSDCVGLGMNTLADGNHEVVLGNSSQTPYAYAQLQVRSDERDKADIRDTILGLDFINALRPIDFRWDLRSDYIDTIDHDDGTTETIMREKDGSRKRKRFHHGFIAQDVKAALDAQGVDFGGYQDHKVNGGGDVLSLGYDEFIAPIIKAIQELSKRLDALERRLGVGGE